MTYNKPIEANFPTSANPHNRYSQILPPLNAACRKILTAEVHSTGTHLTASEVAALVDKLKEQLHAAWGES